MELAEPKVKEQNGSGESKACPELFKWGRHKQVKYWLQFQKNSHLWLGESLTFPWWPFWKWFLKALREEEHFVKYQKKKNQFYHNVANKTTQNMAQIYPQKFNILELVLPVEKKKEQNPETNTPKPWAEASGPSGPFLWSKDHKLLEVKKTSPTLSIFHFQLLFSIRNIIGKVFPTWSCTKELLYLSIYLLVSSTNHKYFIHLIYTYCFVYMYCILFICINLYI